KVRACKTPWFVTESPYLIDTRPCQGGFPRRGHSLGRFSALIRDPVSVSQNYLLQALTAVRRARYCRIANRICLDFTLEKFCASPRAGQWSVAARLQSRRSNPQIAFDHEYIQLF